MKIEEYDSETQGAIRKIMVSGIRITEAGFVLEILAALPAKASLRICFCA